MSAQGDYLRAQLNTVTTFNMMLETVADAFDGATADDASADDASADDANGDDDDNGEPATRSRSPAPRKKVVKRKARRRYY